MVIVDTDGCGTAVAAAVVQGAGNKTGPNLSGVVGRVAGTVPGFSYSAANKSSGAMLTDSRDCCVQPCLMA